MSLFRTTTPAAAPRWRCWVLVSTINTTAAAAAAAAARWRRPRPPAPRQQRLVSSSVMRHHHQYRHHHHHHHRVAAAAAASLAAAAAGRPAPPTLPFRPLLPTALSTTTTRPSSPWCGGCGSCSCRHCRTIASTASMVSSSSVGEQQQQQRSRNLSSSSHSSSSSRSSAGHNDVDHHYATATRTTTATTTDNSNNNNSNTAAAAAAAKSTASASSSSLSSSHQSSTSTSTSCTAIQRRLVQWGRQRRWNDLLELAVQERRQFNHVHCATLLVQLARVYNSTTSRRRRRDERVALQQRHDPRLVQFVPALVRLMVADNDWIRKYPREVSNVVHSLAKLHCHQNAQLRPCIQQLLDCVTDSTSEFLDRAQPQSASLVAWSCAAMRYRPPAEFARQLDETAARWLTTATTTTTTIDWENTPENANKENNQQQQQQRQLQQLHPQAVSNVAWACATLQLPAPQLMEAINQKDAVVWLVREGSPQCLGNLAWSCATQNTPAPRLFAAIDRDAERLLGTRDCSTQTLANLAWACGALGFLAPNLLGLIGSSRPVSRRLVQRGQPQEIANTLWAFAKLKHHDAAPAHLLTALEEALTATAPNGLSRWNAQDLANTAWSCGTLGWMKSPKLFQAIDASAERLIAQGTPQNVSNTAWASATLNVDALPQLFYHINRPEVAEWLVGSSSSRRRNNNSGNSDNNNTTNSNATQTIANLAWACGTLGYEMPVLMKAILSRDTIAHLVRHGSAREVANVVWSCATLGVVADDDDDDYHGANALLQKLGKDDAAFLRENDLDAQSVAILSYATGLLSLLCNKDNDNANANHELHQTILSRLWDQAIDLYNDAGGGDATTAATVFRDEELVQLAQARRTAAANGMDLSNNTVPDSMVTAMEAALAQQYTNETSKASQEISDLLCEVGFDHEVEVSPEALLETMTTTETAAAAPAVGGGMLAIDFACRAQKVAVEYDGPQHFLKAPTRTAGVLRTTRTENGRTKAKRRYLQLCGWRTVIHLDYRDHQQAKRETNNDNPRDWLASVLRRAGVSLSPS